MPQGLEVYNAAGQVTLSIGNRVVKILTEANVTSGVPTSIPITQSAGTQLSVSALPTTSSSFAGNLQPIISTSSSSVGVTWPAGNISGRTVNLLVMEF